MHDDRSAPGPPREVASDREGDAGSDAGIESGPSFEAALEGLEAIVDRLEQGDLELETSLAEFERGVALARRCAGQLEAAERRIEVLVQQGGRWTRAPLDGPPDDPEESEDEEPE